MCACVRVCVCACGWTNANSVETQERNANVEVGRLFSSAILYLLAYKPSTKEKKKTLNYLYWTDDWLPLTPCLRPVCNRTLLQMQLGTAELFPDACAQTRWAAGDGWKKMEKEKKELKIKEGKKISVFTFAPPLVLSSNTVTRNHNYANIARQSCRKSARRMQ